MRQATRQWTDPVCGRFAGQVITFQPQLTRLVVPTRSFVTLRIPNELTAEDGRDGEAAGLDDCDGQSRYLTLALYRTADRTLSMGRRRS